MAEADYDLGVGRLEVRLAKLGSESWDHTDANRLSKRMAKYGSGLLTFLWYDDVPSDNNAGERAIRPAVMIRKNSYCNHGDRGALTQSVLISVLRTVRIRGHQPLDTTQRALATYAATYFTTGVIPTPPQRAESLLILYLTLNLTLLSRTSTKVQRRFSWHRLARRRPLRARRRCRCLR
jgi:hypothetical protein